jgi:Uma2 family endonuclease
MPANVEEPQVHLWTREEYNRMAEAGLFDGKRVELIEGRIFEMPPMKSLHATSLTLSEQVLSRAFGDQYFLRIQMPLSIGDASEPEPDIAVVAGRARDYRDEHPKTAVLVVEIADFSLTHDRTEKAVLYARSGIRDYWIVNLQDRWLEVYRDPAVDPASLLGFTYSTRSILKESEVVSPLAAPDAKIAVEDFLP